MPPTIAHCESEMWLNNHPQDQPPLKSDTLYYRIMHLDSSHSSSNSSETYRFDFIDKIPHVVALSVVSVRLFDSLPTVKQGNTQICFEGQDTFVDIPNTPGRHTPAAMAQTFKQAVWCLTGEQIVFEKCEGHMLLSSTHAFALAPLHTSSVLYLLGFRIESSCNQREHRSMMPICRDGTYIDVCCEHESSAVSVNSSGLPILCRVPLPPTITSSFIEHSFAPGSTGGVCFPPMHLQGLTLKLVGPDGKSLPPPLGLFSLSIRALCAHGSESQIAAFPAQDVKFITAGAAAAQSPPKLQLEIVPLALLVLALSAIIWLLWRRKALKGRVSPSKPTTFA